MKGLSRLTFGTMNHGPSDARASSARTITLAGRLATVRSRVILAVFGLTALALTIAGLTAYSLERALTEGVQRREVLARRHADRARQRGTPR